MMTRKEYLESSIGSTSDINRKYSWEAHRKYYGQFVNSKTIKVVVETIGSENILNSGDMMSFNDIALYRWDEIKLPINNIFKEVGDTYTLAGKVCIAKEAARQYREMSIQE